MLTVIEGKVMRDGQKVAWLDGHHLRSEDGTKLGYFEDPFIYHESGHKVAYTHEGKLVFESDGHSVPLDQVGQKIGGGIPLQTKCLIYALLED